MVFVISLYSMPNKKTIHASSYVRNQAYELVKAELEKIGGTVAGTSTDNFNQGEEIDESVEPNRDELSLVTQDETFESSDSVFLQAPDQESELVACPELALLATAESELVTEAAAILTQNFVEGSDSSQEEVSDSSTNSDTEVESNEDAVRDFLQVWSCKYAIANNAVDSLLGFFKPYYPTLPLSAKTLKGTPRSTNLKVLQNGQYAHLGLKKGLLGRLERGFKKHVDKIEIDVFVDSVSFYDCSNAGAWPIMARCQDFVDARPFVVGIFYGVPKPDPIGDYLADYVKEVKDMKANGLPFMNKNYLFDVRFYLADAPARAYLKCTTGHNSKHGCERCEQCGDYDDQVIFSTRYGPERTDESFNSRRDPEHHKGDSPLVELSTGFISQFVLDPMHLVDIGVFKRFLSFILRRGPPNSRLSGANLYDFSSMLDLFALFVPCEFGRKHPTLDRRSKWKSTEYRLILLYLGVVIFKVILKEELYQLFLLLHSAVFIMSNETFIDCHLENAQNFIECFVKYSSQVFGAKFVSYNVHSLLHLSVDVKMHGALMNFSAYPLEDLGGHLKKKVKSGPRALQQVCRRIAEREKVENKFKQVVNGRGPLIEHNDGPTANLNVTSQFKKFEEKLFTISIQSPDNCICLSDGNFGVIQNIVIVDFSVKLVVKVFECARDLYDYPIASSNLGVCVLWNLSENLVVYELSDNLFKCMLLPYGDNEFVGIPPLHLV